MESFRESQQYFVIAILNLRGTKDKGYKENAESPNRVTWSKTGRTKQMNLQKPSGTE